MRTIRIAIVGAGVWGDTHAAIYREHPLAEPVAICDRDVDRARALADKYGIPSVYGSVEEMLEAGGFDAVSIVTPDHLHADIAVACAAAGKHLLIEKPLATTRADVLRIVRAARESGVRVMVDLHNRWSPPFAEARRMVEEGGLGTLRNAYIRLNDVKWVATDMRPGRRGRPSSGFWAAIALIRCSGCLRTGCGECTPFRRAGCWTGWASLRRTPFFPLWSLSGVAWRRWRTGGLRPTPIRASTISNATFAATGE